MCPQLISVWAVAGVGEVEWTVRRERGLDAPRRAPSGAPTVRRIWGIAVDGVGADGVRTTALSVHISMHTQHELMATEGLPRLPRRRGHGAEAKCRGRDLIRLGAVSQGFQVATRIDKIITPVHVSPLCSRRARVPLSQPPAARTCPAAAVRSCRPPTAAPPAPPDAGSPSCAPCPPPARASVSLA